MDNNLKNYLEKNKIEYKIYNHPAVFTVEESKKIKIKVPGMHTKNLFLKDNKGNFYLICIEANKKLDLAKLKKELNVKKLNFASPEELKSHLNLAPGSVSLFGMIYAKSVYLIIDKSIWDTSFVGFHPNINTATLVVNHENLEKFYNSLKVKKEILEL